VVVLRGKCQRYWAGWYGAKFASPVLRFEAASSAAAAGAAPSGELSCVELCVVRGQGLQAAVASECTIARQRLWQR